MPVELQLQRDPPQITSFLDQLEQSGCNPRLVNYGRDVLPIDLVAIVANPQEDWILWLQR